MNEKQEQDFKEVMLIFKAPLDEMNKIVSDSGKSFKQQTNLLFKLMEKTIKNLVDLEGKNERNEEEIKELKKTIEKLDMSINNEKRQYEELEKNIILTRDQINKDGRTPVLTAEEVEFVRDLRKQGLSYRQIEAEMKYAASHETIRKAVVNDNYKPKAESETNTDKLNALNKTNDSDKNKTNAFGGSL